jgi:citronellol/citronellal dehydrogenase
MHLTDKVIIVTGGSGIGRCTAHELASLGAQVVITGRKIEKLEKSAKIFEDGGKVHFIVCDNRDEEQVKNMIAEVIEKFGKLDGLVNNAGGQFPSALKVFLPMALMLWYVITCIQLFT